MTLEAAWVLCKMHLVQAVQLQKTVRKLQLFYKLKESPLQSVQHVNFIKMFVLLIIVSTQRSALSGLIQTTQKNSKRLKVLKSMLKL
jgi:iron only hydrogenase large subunit-like protein